MSKNMNNETLGLNANLIKQFESTGFSRFQEIQKKCIPLILEGKDLIGVAETGSGKTAAFVLPILNSFKFQKTEKNRLIETLILVPTRELAIQIHEVFKSFKIDQDLSIMPIYGGVSINPQMKNLYGVDILIATPGRLIDLIESKALQLNMVNQLVIDEADKMLNLGFQDEMDRLIDLMPAERQTLMFTATWSDKLSRLERYLKGNHVKIELTKKLEKINEEAIKLGALLCDEPSKGPLLRYLLKSRNVPQTLVFTASGRKADNVAQKLRNNGIDAEAIHSKKTQGVRSNLLTKFKHGKLAVLVATDLLARGVDIDDLLLVINYELPRSPKDFIHRVGRTGRAGKHGEAITILTKEDLHHFKVIKKKAGIFLDHEDASEIDLKGF